MITLVEGEIIIPLVKALNSDDPVSQHFAVVALRNLSTVLENHIIMNEEEIQKPVISLLKWDDKSHDGNTDERYYDSETYTNSLALIANLAVLISNLR